MDTPMPQTSKHDPIKGPNLPTEGPKEPTNDTEGPSFEAYERNAHHAARQEASREPTATAHGAAMQASSAAPCVGASTHQETGSDTADTTPGDTGPSSSAGSAPAAATAGRKRRLRLRLPWLEIDHVLKLTTPAAKWPDYAKVDNVNAIIAGLWPYLSRAAEALVQEQLEPWARDFVQQQGRGVLVGLSLDVLDLGSHPMRLEAVKTYDTEEDELIFEGPLAWASTMRARISADCKLLGMTFKLPLEIRNLQMRVHARLTARPITETPPFIGSVTITLLEKPHLDFDVPLLLPRALLDPLHNWHGLGEAGQADQRGADTGNDREGQAHAAVDNVATAIEEAFTLDLMALPVVRGAFQLAARLAARALLMFPKGYTLEMAPGGSQRPWPEGMLELRLIKITGLRSEDLLGMSDPYCILQVREGRMSRTRTISNDNDPEFNEEFTMLVDSVERQALRLVVKDEDWGPRDKILGVAELPLKQAPFMLCPGMRVPLTMTLRKVRTPRSPGILTAPLNFLIGTPINATLAGTELLSKAIKGSRSSSASSSASSSDDDRDTRSSRDQGSSANGSSIAGNGPGSASSGGRHLKGREARRAERAKGEQHASIARLREGAGRAVRAGHQEEDEVEVVAEYMRQAQQLEEQLQQQEEKEGRQQQQGQGRQQQQQRLQQDQQQRAPYGADAGGRPSQQQQGTPQPVQQQWQAGQQQHQQQQQQRRQAAPHGKQQQQSSSYGTEDLTALAERQMQEESAGEAGRSKLRRGQVQDQLRAETRGTVFLEAVWTPFKRPEMLGGVGGPGFGSGLGPPLAYQRAQQQRQAQPSDLGILTVTLLRATNLTGWSGEPDPYVKFVLHDKILRKQQTQMSSVVFNEPHPRWGEKTDFVMISAGSVLVVTMMDKTTPMERLTTLKLKGRFKDHLMGHVRIPVQHVAAAGRIKHEWPLLGAEQGAIELALEWFPASVAQA